MRDSLPYVYFLFQMSAIDSGKEDTSTNRAQMNRTDTTLNLRRQIVVTS